MRSLYFIAIFLFALANLPARAHPFHVDHTDVELQRMDTESLLHVEGDLRRQNKVVDKHIASLHGRIEQATEKQHALEKAFKKLESGRDWESRQKMSKEKELSLAKAEMQTKRDQMSSISAHADEVRRQIRALEDKMVSLKMAQEDAESRYANPTILDIVDGKIDHLGPTPHRILNKTLHTLLFPGISSGVAGVERLRSHIRGSTQHVAIVSTLAIYAFLVCLIWCCVRAYRRVTGNLTLSRIMFTADMTFAAFWVFVCVWSFALLDDPIAIMRRHNEPLLIATQLLIAIALFWYVSIRCVSLAATLRGTEGLELVACLFIIQHYYQAVWAPSLTDGDTIVGGGVYLAYGSGHLILAARRARSQVLTKQAPRFESQDRIPLKGNETLSVEQETAQVGGFTWFLHQMRLVALAVEALLFTVTPRPDAVAGGCAEYEPTDEPASYDQGRLDVSATDYGDTEDTCSEGN
jgi:hypothetical protein